jgi:5-hydroxyisourate hydrolase
MSKITTHVLDAVLGRPAVGIAVRLDRMKGGWIGEGMARIEDLRWIQISQGATDADGRCRDLAPDAPAGVFRLIFAAGSYLRSIGRTTIFPDITITFQCDGQQHYHLPLLLSDNSYTTYRGS